MFSELSSQLEWFFSWLVTWLIVGNLALLIANLALRLMDKWKQQTTKEGAGGGKKLLAVLGSGGHTAEMLKLLYVQDDLFSTRTYVLANTDKMSVKKIEDFEKVHGNTFAVRTIPRAREVGQSYVSSIPSTLLAIWHSFFLVLQERPDVVMSNGPAIGFAICLFARLFDLCSLHRSFCRVVFVESLCRVKRLSLTGLLLYHLRIPHAFLVQWPDLQKQYPRTEYTGRLV